MQFYIQFTFCTKNDLCDVKQYNQAVGTLMANAESAVCTLTAIYISKATIAKPVHYC